jgi:hypothetical protein
MRAKRIKLLEKEENFSVFRFEKHFFTENMKVKNGK